jgi:outer membrane murein-binding lipoprotein Lpp
MEAKMNKLFLAAIATVLLVLSGCGNLSPRLDQDIDNANGRIDNLETIQNGFKNEIGKMQNDNEIQNSKIGQMQQGIANMQSSNENSGIQILSGPGGLLISIIAMVGVVGMVGITFHFKNVASRKGKTADILAQKITSKQDPILVNQVFQAAMYTDVEEDVLQIMRKHQR